MCSLFPVSTRCMFLLRTMEWPNFLGKRDHVFCEWPPPGPRGSMLTSQMRRDSVLCGWTRCIVPSSLARIVVILQMFNAHYHIIRSLPFLYWYLQTPFRSVAIIMSCQFKVHVPTSTGKMAGCGLARPRLWLSQFPGSRSLMLTSQIWKTAHCLVAQCILAPHLWQWRSTSVYRANVGC